MNEYLKLTNKLFVEIKNEFPEYSDYDIKEDYFEYSKSVFLKTKEEMLKKDSSIFLPDAEYNTEYFPKLSIKHIWNSENISEALKDTIMNYLQLILLSILNDVPPPVKEEVPDFKSMFENLNHKDIEDNIGKIFDTWKSGESESQSSSGMGSILNTSIGKLAMDIAKDQDIIGRLGQGGQSNPQEMLSNLFKNPDNLMSIVKDVGSKIDSKLKNGDINEQDMIKDSMDFLKNSDTSKISEMMKSMGMGGLSDMMGQQSQKPKSSKKVNLGNNLELKKQLLKRGKSVDLTNPTILKNEIYKIKQNLQSNKTDNTLKNPLLTDDEIISLFEDTKK